MTQRNTPPSGLFKPAAAKQTAKHSGRIFTILLFGVLAVLLLAGLGMGTLAFKSIHDVEESTSNMRLALSSLQNRVRANDSTGSLATKNGPEGPALVFSQTLDSGTYETRIYQYQGSIVEETAFSTDSFSPENATKIVASSTFDFTYEGRLLTVTTDQGTLKVALRSGQTATYSPASSTNGRRNG